MRVTKREHACLVIERDGAAIVIDPGGFTEPFEAPGVVAIVLTHEHADHWHAPHLESLLEASPGTPIYGPPGVAAAAPDFDVQIVDAGDDLEAGPFRLRFFGGTHAEIHRSIPLVDNVGVLVDERCYYPGDSFALPDVPVELLAVPAGAPWLKIGEVMDFVVAVAPQQTFATHVATLSDRGLALSNERIRGAAMHVGGRHHEVVAGDTIEI